VEALNDGTLTLRMTAACRSRTADARATTTASAAWMSVRATAFHPFYKVSCRTAFCICLLYLYLTIIISLLAENRDQSVHLFVCPHGILSLQNHMVDLRQILCVFFVTAAPSFSGGIVICHVYFQFCG